MTNRKLRYSGLGLAVLTAGAIAACSSSDPVTPAGGAGSGAGGAHAGGAPATAGTPGAAGAGVAGAAAGAAPMAGTGGAGAGFKCAGTLPTAALITDFSNLVASTASTGNYTFEGGVLGGTFTYQPMALTLDTVTNTVLNIKGNVKAYDGFGLYFNTCYDASAYTGISFNIKGSAGPTGKLNFRVQTNTNTAIDMTNSKGACVSTAADTYPDCHAASFDIPVTAAGAVVTVNFVQFKDGMPSDSVSAKEITGLEWAFNWTPGATGAAGAGAGGAASAGSGAGGASAGSGGAAGGAGGAKGGAGGTSGAGAGAGGASGGSAGAATGAGGASTAGPYNADITIDNIQFIGGPPAGGAGGASSGGASSGGASSGGASSGGASAAGAGGASAGTGGAKGGSAGTAGG